MRKRVMRMKKKRAEQLKNQRNEIEKNEHRTDGKTTETHRPESSD
jgi:hypothetical protein